MFNLNQYIKQQLNGNIDQELEGEILDFLDAGSPHQVSIKPAIAADNFELVLKLERDDIKLHFYNIKVESVFTDSFRIPVIYLFNKNNKDIVALVKE